MRISRKKRPEKQQIRYRMNEWIKAPRLRIVDDEGSFLGIMSRDEALALAEERELDLIEIVPKGDIPVAKLTDYGKFRYQKEKEMKKQKSQSKKTETKGIRISLRIGAHDAELRVKQAAGFLKDGDNVRIELMLKGREKGKRDLARESVMKFVESIRQLIDIRVEQPLSSQGSKLLVVIAPATAVNNKE